MYILQLICDKYIAIYMTYKIVNKSTSYSTIEFYEVF